MKTRIKIIEYGDGTKKYFVQQYKFDTEKFIKMFFLPIIGWVICYVIYLNRWDVMMVSNTLRYGKKYSIFSNIDDAKLYINELMDGEQQKKDLELKTKISMKVVKESIYNVFQLTEVGDYEAQNLNIK